MIEYSGRGKKITELGRVLDRIVHGLAVITTLSENKPYGMTASWFSRVSNCPYMVSVSIWKENYTYQKILQSRVYAINILNGSGKALALHFGHRSGRTFDKFVGISYRRAESGSPIIIEDVNAYIDCSLVDVMDAGDHTIFLGKVLKAEMIKSCEEPLIYHREDFI